MISSLTNLSGPTLTKQGSASGAKVCVWGGGWSPIYIRSDQSGIGMGTSFQIGQIPVVPEVHIPATMRAEGCVLQPS